MPRVRRPALARLKRLAGARPELAARLRAFALLAFLVPLFSGFGVAAQQGAPRIEVRFVPSDVPVEVLVTVPVLVERIVERVVYVPIPLDGFGSVRTILNGPLLRPIPGPILAAGLPLLPGTGAALAGSGSPAGTMSDPDFLTETALSRLVGGRDGQPTIPLLPGQDGAAIPLGGIAAGSVPAVELRSQPNGVAIVPALGVPAGLPAVGMVSPADVSQSEPGDAPSEAGALAPGVVPAAPGPYGPVAGGTAVVAQRGTPLPQATPTPPAFAMLRVQATPTAVPTQITLAGQQTAPAGSTPVPAPVSAHSVAPNPPVLPTPEPTSARAPEPAKPPTAAPPPRATSQAPVSAPTSAPTVKLTNIPVPQPAKTATRSPRIRPSPLQPRCRCRPRGRGRRRARSLARR
jgi:hypothetical protein